jgi:transposase
VTGTYKGTNVRYLEHIIKPGKLRDDMIKRHEITDRDWERIKDALPAENTGEGRPSKPNRVMLNGMLWRARTGAPWRDLPDRYGPWQTVYHRFRLWSKNNVFLLLFEQLASDADTQDIAIDSTSCKAHQHAAGAKRGRQTQKPTKT